MPLIEDPDPCREPVGEKCRFYPLPGAPPFSTFTFCFPRAEVPDPSAELSSFSLLPALLARLKRCRVPHRSPLPATSIEGRNVVFPQSPRALLSWWVSQPVAVQASPRDYLALPQLTKPVTRKKPADFKHSPRSGLTESQPTMAHIVGSLFETVMAGQCTRYSPALARTSRCRPHTPPTHACPAPKQSLRPSQPAQKWGRGRNAAGMVPPVNPPPPGTPKPQPTNDPDAHRAKLIGENRRPRCAHHRSAIRWDTPPG